MSELLHYMAQEFNLCNLPSFELDVHEDVHAHRDFVQFTDAIPPPKCREPTSGPMQTDGWRIIAMFKPLFLHHVCKSGRAFILWHCVCICADPLTLNGLYWMENNCIKINSLANTMLTISNKWLWGIWLISLILVCAISSSTVRSKLFFLKYLHKTNCCICPEVIQKVIQILCFG